MGGFSAASPVTASFTRGGVQIGFNSNSLPGIGRVSNVCPIFGFVAGEQVVTGITVEYTNPDGSKVCVANPTSCCAGSGSGSGIVTDCCPDVELPPEFCLTVSGGTGGQSHLNGSYLISLSNDQWSYSGVAADGTNCTDVDGDPCVRWGLACGGNLPIIGGFSLSLSGSILGGSVINFGGTLISCSPFKLTFSTSYFGQTLAGTITSNLAACQGSGSGGPCNIMDVALGSASACSPGTTLSFTTAGSVTAGALVIVNLQYDATLSGGSFPAVTMGGVAMTFQDAIQSPSATVAVAMFYATAAATGAVTFQATIPAAAAYIYMSAVQVTGLANNLSQDAAATDGSASGPSVALSSGYIAPCLYVQALFGMATPSGAFTWAAPFTSGGQDITACSPYVMTEGFDIIPSGGAGAGLTAKLNGITAADWAGIIIVFS